MVHQKCRAACEKKLDSPHRADYDSPIHRRSPRRGTSGVTEGLARPLWPATLASPLIHEAFTHGKRYYKVFVSLCVSFFRHVRLAHLASQTCPPPVKPRYSRLSTSDQPFHQTVSFQRLTNLCERL